MTGDRNRARGAGNRALLAKLGPVSFLPRRRAVYTAQRPCRYPAGLSPNCRYWKGVVAVKTAAAIYVEKDKDLVIDDIDLPDPGPTQVLVKQFATGICHSQLHELDRPAPAFPLVLGHESTGVVVAK